MKEVDKKIMELHIAGRSIRSIATEVFYSKSYVQSVIKSSALAADNTKLEKRVEKLEKQVKQLEGKNMDSTGQ